MRVVLTLFIDPKEILAHYQNYIQNHQVEDHETLQKLNRAHH
jgi:hypothetical protein